MLLLSPLAQAATAAFIYGSQTDGAVKVHPSHKGDMGFKLMLMASNKRAIEKWMYGGFVYTQGKVIRGCPLGHWGLFLSHEVTFGGQGGDV